MTTTIAAVVEASAVPPRVRLSVTTDQPTVTLYQVRADGTRVPVRSYDGDTFVMAGTSMVAYDNEVPYGLPVSYTADGSGVTNSGTVTVTVTKPWLINPVQPALSRAITVSSLGERSQAANINVRYPLGARVPIVVHDGRRKAATYDLSVRTQSLADQNALEAMLADLTPLLLNIPTGLSWGQTSEWVSVGNVTARRTVAWGPHPLREWSLPCTVVGRPLGGARPPVTYGDSFAKYPTYGDRFAAHATYGQANDPANY